MGHAISYAPVRSTPGEKSRRLLLYWDTGSSLSFIEESAARGLKALFPLPAPKGFGGLGNGRFESAALLAAEVRLLGVWCPYVIYVVPDGTLGKVGGKPLQVLIGNEFMELYGIRIDPRNHRPILHRESLLSAMIVRSPIRAIASRR